MDAQVGVGRDDVDAVRLGAHAGRHLDNLHPDIGCQHTREHARAARIEVLNHDEGHARVIGQAAEELPQRLEAARRRTDRDDRKRRPHGVGGWVVGLLAHLAP